MRWKISWITKTGEQRTTYFQGITNRTVALVDAKLLLLDRGEKYPRHIELEEVEGDETAMGSPVGELNRAALSRLHFLRV